MRWELSSEQSDFRAVLADWLSEVCPAEQLREWLDAGDHASFEKRLPADGWFGVGSPEELGGEGGGLVELALAAEQFGRRAAPSGAWLGAMVALPLLAGAPDAAREMLAEGATTVPAAPAGAVPGDGPVVEEAGGRLTGTVPAVLAAGRARRLVVPAGDAWWLADADASGVDVRPLALTDRSRSVADVTLDGVPGRRLAAPAGDAAALRAAVLVAADSLGVMGRMLDTTLEYVGQRRQFGVPIGSFQAVKHAAAEMLVKVESARSIVYLAAASVDGADPDSGLHAAAAKAQVCAAGRAAADTALTLHGAIGYTWEHDLQILYKRALLDAELFGTPDAWNDRIADALDLAGPPVAER